jgi:hypothetical protein
MDGCLRMSRLETDYNKKGHLSISGAASDTHSRKHSEACSAGL